MLSLWEILSVLELPLSERWVVAAKALGCYVACHEITDSKTFFISRSHSSPRLIRVGSSGDLQCQTRKVRIPRLDLRLGYPKVELTRYDSNAWSAKVVFGVGVQSFEGLVSGTPEESLDLLPWDLLEDFGI